MAEWKRPETLIIANYIREEEKNIVQGKKLLALMQKKGLFKFNESGTKMNWKVRKSRQTLTPYADTQVLTPERFNRHEEAELNWRGYVVAEAVTEKEKQMCKSKEAIINYVKKLTDYCLEDAKDEFPAEFFKDGNAAGNTSRIHGFPSWLGVTGSNQWTAPSDTYAGLSTVLGNYGGSIESGSWPTGTFTPDYYFWSPLIVNYTHASWGAGTDTWANNCLEALSAAFIHQRNIKGKQGELDMVLVTATMYEQFLNQIRTKERINVMKGGEESMLVKLGFGGVTNWDGVDITFDYDIPDTQGYGLALDTMRLRCLTSQLFVPKKDFDITNLSDQFALFMFGNLQGNPRATVLFDNIT